MDKTYELTWEPKLWCYDVLIDTTRAVKYNEGVVLDLKGNIEDYCSFTITFSSTGRNTKISGYKTTLPEWVNIGTEKWDGSMVTSSYSGGGSSVTVGSITTLNNSTNKTHAFDTSTIYVDDERFNVIYITSSAALTDGVNNESFVGDATANGNKLYIFAGESAPDHEYTIRVKIVGYRTKASSSSQT